MSQPWARAEMEQAAIWDRRCVRSLARICECRLDRPRGFFSTACGAAVRQAAHRICTRPTTTVDGLLRGHFAQTADRCLAQVAADPEAPILVITDTTSFNYSSHPATRGLGPIDGREAGRGLLSHAALALPLHGPPLGLTHLSLWARDPATFGKNRVPHAGLAEPTAQKESQKWIDALWGTEATLAPALP